MRVYDWERRVDQWVGLSAPTRLRSLVKWVNLVLAGEEAMTVLGPWLATAIVVTHWQSGGGWLVALLFVMAFLSARHVEAWLKPLLGQRGRPRDPRELGMPSGDCMIVTIWALPLLGWTWAWLPIGVVMLARMALRAHWALDTVVGVGVGVGLILPAMVW